MKIRQTLVQQFKRPSGFLGRLAGYIMANRSSNIQRNRWMLEMIGLESSDKVLEIGHGPGLALEGALKVIHEGTVVGIDHSETMNRQATHRNKLAISQGRAQLLIGDIQSSPGFDMKFDHIYSANVVQFWQQPVEVFKHLATLLSAGGDVTTLLMPRQKGATSQDAQVFAEKIGDWLQQAGYSSISTEFKDFNDLATVCVIAKV